MPDLIVTASPHLKTDEDIPVIMQEVCLALVPAFAVAFVAFHSYALLVTGLCVGSCLITEHICQALRGRRSTVGDWSAVVTGLLLAAVLPPYPIWYVPVIGGAVSIGIAKHAFGGLGHNIWNPALLGRAFLQVAFPNEINAGQWPSPARQLSLFAEKGADTMTQATKLTELGSLSADAPGHVIDVHWFEHTNSVLKLFLGQTAGCIGEISAFALLVGGLYLLAFKVIRWHIPVVYIATVGILTWILPQPYDLTSTGETVYTAWFTGPWAYHVFGGGLMIGAFFMATDYVTSPMTTKGKIIFALGCGILTVVIRLYSSAYPEGVCYSILIMNTLVPAIDTYTRPKVFGTGLKKTG